MDIIYKIYSVYLYDNQLDHDYFILYNKRISFTGTSDSELPHTFSGSSNYGAFYQIGELHDKTRNDTSIEIMRLRSKLENIPFICTKDFLTIEKVGETYNPNYNIYDIYWNETKSGINIFEYDLAAVWNIGKITYSTYRIFEEKNNRESVIRNSKIEGILG